MTFDGIVMYKASAFCPVCLETLKPKVFLAIKRH